MGKQRNWEEVREQVIEMMTTAELSRLYWTLEKSFSSADRTVVKFAVKGCKTLGKNYYKKALLALRITESDYEKTFMVTIK